MTGSAEQVDAGAKAYGGKQAAGVDVAVWPPLPSPSYQPRAAERVEAVRVQLRRTHDVSPAVVVSQWTNNDDVRFGRKLSGCGVPTPLHVSLNWTWTVGELVTRLAAATRLRAHNNDDGDEESSIDGGFQSAVAVHSAGGIQDSADFALPILLQVEFSAVDDHVLQLGLRYDARGICHEQAACLLRHARHVLEQIDRAEASTPIAALSAVDAEEQTRLVEQNAQQELTVTDECIHDVISEQARTAPSRPAVASWDGDLSYLELDQLSSRLAQHLAGLGVGSGESIPLCFEKSLLTLVCMLAVLKAGANLVLLDSTHPRARLQDQCERVAAKIALVSKAHRSTLHGIVWHCVAIDVDFLETLPERTHAAISRTRSSEVAYHVFTSGSTNKPKCIAVKHTAFVSSARCFGTSLLFSQSTRALQFASYSFGACLVETLTVLMFGGCVVVPSEHDRANRIADFMRESAVNWALFTPSAIAAVQPEQVPDLETLVLGGEPITPAMRDTWASCVKLFCAYGQSETSTICSTTRVYPDSHVQSIGHGVGARLWLVDPHNIDSLIWPGCVGEIIVESAGVARGYSDDDQQTAHAFVSTPKWAVEMARPKGIAFFRTGDLGQLDSDGRTIICLGRKDSQVKIRKLSTLILVLSSQADTWSRWPKDRTW